MTDDDRTEITDAFETLSELFADDRIGDTIDDPTNDPEHASTVDLDDPDTYEGDIWYPSVADVLAIHEEVIETGGEPGIDDADRIEFVIEQLRGGPAGYGPRTLPEKAFALMRYLAANHYFVDGNKRTALATTEVFLNFNGVELQYGDEIRTFLKKLAHDESRVDTVDGVEFLRERMVTDIEEWSPQTALFLLLRELDDRWSDRKN